MHKLIYLVPDKSTWLLNTANFQIFHKSKSWNICKWERKAGKQIWFSIKEKLTFKKTMKCFLSVVCTLVSLHVHTHTCCGFFLINKRLWIRQDNALKTFCIEIIGPVIQFYFIGCGSSESLKGVTSCQMLYKRLLK